MAVYSYYYGASIDRGITVQAQSKELEGLPIRQMLKELAALHALDSSDHSGEMLSYLLSSGGASVLGTSYLESPKSSGYSRSAPCGLMYVTPDEELAAMSDKLRKIVNFANFQKPHSPSPAPMDAFPVNESGYSFSNSNTLLMPLVDALVRIALPKSKEVVLIGLPRSKTSSYATARYTIADALGYLPAELRSKIRFFTGLPVAENETDPLKGFDNAVAFGANVIFCPNEFLSRLKAQRSCIALNMEAPAGQVNTYAQFIVNAPDTSIALAQLSALLHAPLTYQALNTAATRVKSGEVLSLNNMQKALSAANADIKKLRQDLDNCVSANKEWEIRCKKLQAKLQQTEAAGNRPQPNAPQQPAPAYGSHYFPQTKEPEEEPETESDDGSRVLFRILNVLCAVLLVVITVVCTVFVTDWLDSTKASKEATQQVVTTTTDVPQDSRDALASAVSEDPVPTTDPLVNATPAFTPDNPSVDSVPFPDSNYSVDDDDANG